MEQEITRLSAKDLPRLLSLAAQVKDEGGLAEYYAHALSRPDIDVLVLRVAGVDAGWCLLNCGPKYGPYQRLKAPEIQDLNILPAYRQRGLASLLIRVCEQTAKGRGATHIGISFGLTADYGPAQRLYIKLGYMPDGAGLMYDRVPVARGAHARVDDDLTLMLIKPLKD